MPNMNSETARRVKGLVLKEIMVELRRKVSGLDYVVGS